MPLPLNTIITDRKETVELRVLTTPQDTMIASIGVLDDQFDIEFMTKDQFDTLKPAREVYIYCDDQSSLSIYNKDLKLEYKFVFQDSGKKMSIKFAYINNEVFKDIIVINGNDIELCEERFVPLYNEYRHVEDKKYMYYVKGQTLLIEYGLLGQLQCVYDQDGVVLVSV